MNNFLLKFDVDKSEVKIQHNDDILLIGSCFSDEIANHFKQTGHSVLSNPFGTIFHPSVIAYNLLYALGADTNYSIFERDGMYYSWRTSTSIYGTTKEELIEKLNLLQQQTAEKLKTAKVIFVTFGSAWGYELNDTNELVANCHKMPAQLFTKFLSSPYELLQDWVHTIEQLKKINPSLQIVFTVSPVRHIKDGLVENNLSKARLIEVVQQLSMEENCSYFPSYELMVDVLRDYRFYKSDLVHPNEMAIQFIWEKVEETFMESETIQLNKEVANVNRFAEHKSFTNPVEHQLKATEKKQLLHLKHPEVTFY